MYIARLPRFLLFSTVFLTGAAVLILEVAAVRLLTPTFGSSLFVLSSVLSTILFALSLGYFVGGRLADRAPHHLPLYAIIMMAGLSLLLLLWGSLSVLEPGTISSSQIGGPLIVSLLFFFIPAFLLGMDSPYVIKLLSLDNDTEHNGAYVGTTFFWSTVGSILGSLSSGFWLIPTFGVTTTLIYTSLVLVLLGAAVPWLIPARDVSSDTLRNYLVLLCLSIIASLFIATRIVAANDLPANIILAYDGLYSHIRVEEQVMQGNPVRLLRRDTNNSSAVYLDRTDHVFSYSRFADLYDTLVPDAERFLMVGGGAYTIPRRLVDIDKNLLVDVVEIEPSLYQLAQDYFDLSDTSRITNYTMDARVYLERSTTTYDVVFTDAMSTAHSAPFHLTTREFYQRVADNLQPNGAMITNYIGMVSDEPNSMTSAVYHTINGVFPYVAVYQSRPHPKQRLQNIIFLASQTPLPESLASTSLPHHNTNYELVDLHVPNDFFSTPTPLVLTDDRAPVELLMARQLQQSIR